MAVKKTMTFNWLSTIFIIIGLILLVVAIFVILGTSQYTETTTGTVKNIITGYKKNNIEIVYSVNGVSYTKIFTSSIRTSIGSNVTIYYKKDNPQQSSLTPDSNRVFSFILVLIFALLFLGMGIYYLFNPSTGSNSNGGGWWFFGFPSFNLDFN